MYHLPSHPPRDPRGTFHAPTSSQNRASVIDNLNGLPSVSSLQSLEQQKIDIEREKLNLDKEKFALDQRKFEHERHNVFGLDRYEAARNAEKPGREAVIKFAEIGIRSLLLLNGGAALSLLAFIGHANQASHSNFTPNAWAWVFALFAMGAAASVASAGLSYIAQVWAIPSTRMSRFALKALNFNSRQCFVWIRNAAFGVATIGMACFFFGLNQAYIAMKIAPPPQQQYPQKPTMDPKLGNQSKERDFGEFIWRNPHRP